MLSERTTENDETAGDVLMQKTTIEWADYSVNPLKFRVPEKEKPINLCVPVSPGCQNCYAAAIVNRFQRVKYGKSAMDEAEPVLIEKEIQAMLNFKPKPPFKNGRSRAAVFPCDMTDLFGPWVPFELIDRLFAVFALRDDVDWLVLTKHPERMAEYFEYNPCEMHEKGSVAEGTFERIARCCEEMAEQYLGEDTSSDYWDVWLERWPLPNAWLGTSVEDQKRADDRIDHLRRCPAAIRFLSAEPLLGPISTLPVADIQLVIIGGENGPRSMNLDWNRELLNQCRTAGVAAFEKQWGSNPVSGVLEVMDIPAIEAVKHPKGGDPAEWLEEFRIREMPGAATPV